MSFISNYIDKLNRDKRKALSIFLTVGFPNKNNFVNLAKNILDAGADMIELGIPFSDPLADGPIIQASSKIALENMINLKDVFAISEHISSYSSKPVILMGYANPIRRYGMKNFFTDAANSGVKGLIVPDVPLDEYEEYFNSTEMQFMGSKPDLILLTTPTSSDQRIREIDAKSEGFVYCVSVSGITGVVNKYDESAIDNLKRSYSIIKKNKMMIGFGISKPEDIKNFSPFCDGFIVGSRIIKSIMDGERQEETLNIISGLACDF